MPSLMARICGICPVSHLIASAKACDSLLAVRIPPTADKLRRIFGLAQVTQSHALSLFHLSSPDLLLGMDADPAKSNIFGVAEQNPALALDGIKLRQFGQKIIERLGGSAFIPPGSFPAGLASRSAKPIAMRSCPACPRLLPSPNAPWNGSRAAWSASGRRFPRSATFPRCSWVS